MKRALVCGAGGFIGGHLVKKLKIKVIGFGEWTSRSMNFQPLRQKNF
jgi:nucleoside-diphosphate-sugar epimerase